MASILLIEPDKLLADNVARVLKKSGHSIEQRVDPQAALDFADSNLPDAIILDLVLAGRGGVEFLYEFRSYPDWQSVPVVIFSSLSPQELATVLPGLEHLNLAAYHYKPATALSDLAKSLDRILQPVSG